MLDVKLLEENPEKISELLSRRGEIPGLDRVVALAGERRQKIAALQKHQTERNDLNAGMKKASKEEIEAKRDAMKALSVTIKEAESEVKALEETLDQLLLGIPNPPREDVPVGADESANVVLKTIGTPRTFTHAVKDHVALAESIGLVDFERAAKLSGARFSVLTGHGARLARALTTFMLDYHLERGDYELAPPYLVGAEAMTGTGQLPKFEDDAFKVLRGDHPPLYLIPTAEVPLTNFYGDEILEEEELPRRLCAYTACFRAEAGSAGRDTRGMIRQHQFDKVEMVRFATEDQADAELDLMVERASGILSALELPHRTMLLCTGDIGFTSEKTVDLEVWLPGQDAYREISSCSTFGTFQARRAKIRYRPVAEGTKKAKPRPITTLNGSGLAVGRTLVAVLENHQLADGAVNIPEVLRPYMGGMEVLASRKV